jgi:ATP-dependent DNA helicase DinG
VSPNPAIEGLLALAVAGIGGAERPGQVTMANAVARAIETGEHLAVQAGTGTGKSLAYLVPAAAHGVGEDQTVVVSTATIALQPDLGRALTFAILKGRRNYLCRQKLHAGPGDDEPALIDVAEVSAVGRQVRRLHEWAATTTTGDRDELVPGVGEQAWRQVSVSARECLGAQRCPYGTKCFAELAREKAGRSDIVVTNHALLAIDALEDFDIFPEHDVVVIDEAHDLVDRVTSVASDELSVPAVEAAARRCGKMAGEDAVARLRDAGAGLERVLADAPVGRIDVLGEALAAGLESVRDAALGCAKELRAGATESEEDADRTAVRRAATVAVDEISEAAGRMLAAFGPAVADRTDVVWLERTERGSDSLVVAPLSVAGLLANRLFGDRTVVLTSATLALGGSFEPLARQWGLHSAPPAAGDGSPESGEGHSLAWDGIDVGSPFDHPRSGILYVARHLPPPGRDGLAPSYLDELAELIEAAGGGTLGLFTSMRAARQAADELAGRISVPLLCQGDDQTAQLVSAFAADEPTCLFGTLSLWQGVDVPGPSLRLVVIDRIPFPRPDDPLASARQRAVAARGGNGFMTVAATQAALLLAQGSGRLLRTVTDRGVVAVLDPRLATARYAGFLRASLPPFWTTTDPVVVRAALRRLRTGAGSTPR